MFDFESVTSVGGRTINEDAVDFCDVGDCVCWIIADGLGGHRGGEIASRLAIDVALQSFRSNPTVTTSAVQGHLEAANASVLRQQTEDPILSQMQTTLVILVSDGLRAVWGHIGDSRLYHFRGGSICFQTRDHSVSQTKVDAGEVSLAGIREDEDRNRLLQSIGKTGRFRPEVIEAPRELCRGDAFLLCVDGFWTKILEPEMEIDLAKSPSGRQWLKVMEGRLRERVRARDDNYSAIVIRTTNQMLPSPPVENRVTRRSTKGSTGWHSVPGYQRVGLVGALCLALVLGAAIGRVPGPPPPPSSPDYPLRAVKVDQSQTQATKTVPLFATEVSFGINEVTQEVWKQVVGNNPSKFQRCPKCPVENVTWWDALEYANRMSDLAHLPRCYRLVTCRGELGSGLACEHAEFFGTACRGFRLPTDQEWLTIAAPSDRRDDILRLSWFLSNSDKRTHPVGSKGALANGLSDVFGNVAEWVWVQQSAVSRSYRGGSWATESERFSPATWPMTRELQDASNEIGFRLVVTKMTGIAIVRPIPKPPNPPAANSPKVQGPPNACLVTRQKWQLNWKATTDPAEESGQLKIGPSGIKFTPNAQDQEELLWQYEQIESFKPIDPAGGSQRVAIRGKGDGSPEAHFVIQPPHMENYVFACVAAMAETKSKR